MLIAYWNNSFTKFFLYSQAEFIFFKTDIDGQNSIFSTLLVQFQIPVLFVVIVCEIGAFLNTNHSDINAVNCSFPHFSKFSITPRTVSGTITFGLLSLVRWSWVKGFTVMHLTNWLTSEENRWLKDSLPSCLLLDSAGMSFQSRQSSNLSITRAISGLHTSQRRRAESSSLLSKSLAPPAPLTILLFYSWIWSNPILENSWLDFWNEKFPFEK